MFHFRRAVEAERYETERLIRACGAQVRDYFDMRGREDYWRWGEIWVCEWQDTLVAFTVMHPLKREPVFSMYQVGVHPEWRGLGLATKLVLTAMASDKSKRTLRLVTNEDNEEAIAMYRRWGLEDRGLRETRRNGMVRVFEGEPKWTYRSSESESEAARSQPKPKLGGTGSG